MWGSSSSNSKDGSVQNYDMNSRQLNDLYKRPVISIQSFERPLNSDTRHSSAFHHKGVVATMDNGDRYLVHKGSGFGKQEGGNTVVVDAKHMSSRWQPTSPPQATPANYGLSDLVKAGGKNYNVVKDNCIHATNRMMRDGKK